MTERERIIERLRAVDLSGGSHESLSAIAKAIYEPAGGWTIGACEKLRNTLVRLLEEAEDVDQGARIIASDEGWDEGYKAGYDAGFASADDWCAQHEDAMAEHGWMRRPVAHDGKPWYVFEQFETSRGEIKTVAYVCEGGIITKDGTHYTAACYDHYHVPTVEEVLREFADEMNQNLGMYTGEAIDADEWRSADNKTIAEYAAKLRLADDGKEQ